MDYGADQHPVQHGLTMREYTELWTVLGELKAGGKERKEQVTKLFEILAEHSETEQKVLTEIKSTMTKINTSYEHCITQLQDYSAKCELTDRALDARINVLEDDNKIVKGTAKIAVWVSTIAGGVVAVVEFYRYAFK